MFLSIGMLKQKYFLTDIFILSAVFQPIKLSWRKIEWLRLLLRFFWGRRPELYLFRNFVPHHLLLIKSVLKQIIINGLQSPERVLFPNFCQLCQASFKLL